MGVSVGFKGAALSVGFVSVELLLSLPFVSVGIAFCLLCVMFSALFFFLRGLPSAVFPAYFFGCVFRWHEGACAGGPGVYVTPGI